MVMRLAVNGPKSQEEHQLIKDQLNDWEWSEKGGRPRKVMPAHIARSVLADLIDTRNLSAVARKYEDVFPFSRVWLKYVFDSGRLEQMAFAEASA